MAGPLATEAFVTHSGENRAVSQVLVAASSLESSPGKECCILISVLNVLSVQLLLLWAMLCDISADAMTSPEIDGCSSAEILP